jgi:hypothetical protein
LNKATPAQGGNAARHDDAAGGHRHQTAATGRTQMRFGQLIANLAFLAAGPWDQTLWDLEDDEMLKAIQQHLADLTQRQ